MMELPAIKSCSEQDAYAVILAFCRIMPSAFIEFVMRDEKNKPIVQAQFHHELQRIFQEQKNAVIMLPREHGKTTQVLGYCAWLIGNNPSIRIKIICSSYSLAESRGAFLRNLLETPQYKEVFPEIKITRPCADSRFRVQHRAMSVDNTVECYGLHSATVGGRADVLIFDDVDDEEVTYSAITRRKNAERVMNVWLNMLSPQGKAFVLCTPYHEEDTAHQLLGLGWTLYKRNTTIEAPLWSERWHELALRQKRNSIGALAFARNFELKLVAPTQVLCRPEHLVFDDNAGIIKTIAIAMDLGTRAGKGDYTALVACGLTDKGKIVPIRVWRGQVDYKDMLNIACDFVENLMKIYSHTPFFGVESVAFQYVMFDELRRLLPCPVVPLQPLEKKQVRLERLSVYIQQGKVVWTGSWEQLRVRFKELFDELFVYPASAHDDVIDAFAYAVDMLATHRHIAKGKAVATVIRNNANPEKVRSGDVR